MGRTRMIGRLTMATGLAAGAVLLAASPAAAKGPQSASIAPEGATAVEVSSDTADDAFYDLVDAAGYWSAMELEGVDVPVVLPAPGAADLGPSVRVVWRNGPGEVDGGGVGPQLVQVLYPWATPQPVAFVAGGQPTFGDDRTTERWLRLRPAVVPALAAVGVTRDGLVPSVPDAKPSSSAEDGAVDVAGDDADAGRPIGALAGAGMLVTATIAAAVLVRRRSGHRSTQPATAA